MAIDKPSCIRDYCSWLESEHGCEITPRSRTYYELASAKIRSQVEQSAFWTTLVSSLRSIDDKYRLHTGYPLMSDPKQPELLIKSYDSFLEKTYRLNVVNNRNWDSAPKGGWLLPNGWLSRVNDIIRTSITVKYLDGVEFVIAQIVSLFPADNSKIEYTYEAKMEGYYAAHLYFTDTYEIPKENWDTERLSVKLEIQITTQLQEIIKGLLHKYYEDRRVELAGAERKWQWDYTSMEFSTNYLGHILHYVEGMIVDIREKQKGVLNDRRNE